VARDFDQIARHLIRETSTFKLTKVVGCPFLSISTTHRPMSERFKAGSQRCEQENPQPPFGFGKRTTPIVPTSCTSYFRGWFWTQSGQTWPDHAS
jgi:hypothetical protein